MVTIYGIRNVMSNATYVGCTRGKLAKRMREHRCLLRAGKHSAKLLQADWNVLGASNFRMVILSELPEEATVTQKREEELKWMLALRSVGLLYNEYVQSFSPPEGAPAKAAAARKANGYRPSAASNLKRRLAQLGRPKGHGAKISATKRAQAMR